MSEAAAPMRVGLIGLGAIGGAVVRLVRERHGDEMTILGALVRDAARVRAGDSPPALTSLEELLRLRPEVVVEAAGHAALRAYGPAVLRAGCDLVLLSVGALAEQDLHQALVAASRQGGGRARVASGAIAALDALAAAAVGGLERVTLVTRKPARTLLGPAEAAELTAERELFRGTARDAARAFPASLNVAAAVGLAGIGLDRTEVRVLADPAIDRNRHELVAEGAFGRLQVEIANVPSADNPRTGRLVAMSVVHALRQRRSAIALG